jgi:hypothetical protein
LARKENFDLSWTKTQRLADWWVKCDTPTRLHEGETSFSKEFVMKKTILSLVLAAILGALPCGAAFAQGTPAFPAVWKQSETPDSGERTVDGVWTWDAARKQATAKWSNGASAVINVVTDDGKTVVMCRYDTTGSAVGMVADYVGVRNGNTISGKVFWRDPLRDKQRSGKWTATFGGGVDLSGAWSIAPSAKTEFGTDFTGPKMFRLERTAEDTFMIPDGSSRAKVRFVNGELRFYSNSGAERATGKLELGGSGAAQRIIWSDGSIFTRNR